jgi:hypothetical protein
LVTTVKTSIAFLLYKCPVLKSKDFKPQEKRERKIGKSVCVGGGAERKKENKKERKN